MLVDVSENNEGIQVDKCGNALICVGVMMVDAES